MRPPFNEFTDKVKQKGKTQIMKVINVEKRFVSTTGLDTEYTGKIECEWSDTEGRNFKQQFDADDLELMEREPLK